MADKQVPENAVIVIFGANGDLAGRKLLPSLFHLHVEGLLPKEYRIIGNSRSELTDDEFREFTREAIVANAQCDATGDAWVDFARRLSWVSHEVQPETVEPVADAIRKAEADIGGPVCKLFYLAVPPAAFETITWSLGTSGLADGARVIFEKPFGRDLADFQRLSGLVHSVLSDEQIYRIDHFLGKETVQNILAFRFANGMFEPAWNRQHIDHVQIEVLEEGDIAKRGPFYDQTGAIRDMLVTHLFQLLGFVALEAPYALDEKPLAEEVLKVFETIKPLEPGDVVRGQYEDYRQADGVDPNSDTDTFVAARVCIDNWRWAGVPFFLRTGKALKERRSCITLAFKDPPRQMFTELDQTFERDHLTLELGSPEGIHIDFLTKVPGPHIELAPARMVFEYEGSFGSEMIGPYERLLHDALLGDRMLFTRGDGIERAWEIVDEILHNPPSVLPYARGSWGPEAADEFIAPREWHASSRRESAD